MRKFIRFIPILAVGLSILACNLNSSLLTASPTAAPVSDSTPTSTSENTAVANQPTATPQTSVDKAADAKLDPCSLISVAEAETILAEPVSPAKNINGSCVFSNAKDALYMLNVAVAQDKETNGILQGMAMQTMFTGSKPSADFTNKIRTLADALDFKAFFTELVTVSKGSPVMSAKMFSGGGNDLTYWAWITAPPRRQGGFVAVRGTTLVNINVVVADTQKEDALLPALNNLSSEIYKKLPAKFSLGIPTSAPAPQGQPTSAAAPAAEQTAPTPTLIPSILQAPAQLSPADGTVFNNYPRTTTLAWSPVDRAAKYIVEIMACSSGNPSDCFVHPMVEKTSRETTSTSYTFNFVGAQPGKWRVTAEEANGIPGTPSAWWTFKYTK